MTDQQRGMAAIADSPLSQRGPRADRRPERRTWGTYNLAALWVGLSIVITTYTLGVGADRGRHDLVAGAAHGRRSATSSS